MASIPQEVAGGPKAGCLEALRRCRQVAEAVAPSDFDIEGRSLGAHMRHCLEHASALIDGLDTGVICYDERPREREIERDPARFLASVTAIIGRLESLSSDDVFRPIAIRVIVDPDGNVMEVESTVARELHFVAGHAIHHLATVRLIGEELKLNLPSQLDLAFSTEQHRKTRPSDNNPAEHS